MNAYEQYMKLEKSQNRNAEIAERKTKHIVFTYLFDAVKFNDNRKELNSIEFDFDHGNNGTNNISFRAMFRIFEIIERNEIDIVQFCKVWGRSSQYTKITFSHFTDHLNGFLESSISDDIKISDEGSVFLLWFVWRELKSQSWNKGKDWASSSFEKLNTINLPGYLHLAQFDCLRRFVQWHIEGKVLSHFAWDPIVNSKFHVDPQIEYDLDIEFSRLI